MYNIGEVANMFQLTVSTLRYYDKIGLFTETIKRDPAGIRKFGDAQIETLTVIECLKKAGMQLRDRSNAFSIGAKKAIKRSN